MTAVATTAVITGLIRSPETFEMLVDRLCLLRAEGLVDRIVLSTWTTELPGLRDLGDRSVEVLVSDPIATDTYRNYRRQHHLLALGLDVVEPTDHVLKLRPDWVVSSDTLRAFTEPQSPPSPPAGLPSVLARRVRLPWWSTRVPFHLADESLGGLATDLRHLNPEPGVAALADPHAARFLPAMTAHFPVLRFALDVMLPFIADSTPDDAVVCERFGRSHECAQRRKKLQMIGPFRHQLTSLALEVPSYQRAVAAYHVLLDSYFDIVNPTPHDEQFIVRHGPWPSTTPDVSRSGDPFQSPDPLCFVSAASASLASRVPKCFEAYHDAIDRYSARPLLLIAEPDASVVAEDVELLHHKVDAFRRRAGLREGTVG
jgi:hypothetical protein